MIMYTQDYDEKYPSAANGGATDGPDGKSNRWYDVVNPYVKNKQQVWICPTAGPLRRYGGSDGYTYGGYAYNVAGSQFNRNPFTGVGIANYGNGFGLTNFAQTPTYSPVSLSEVQEPSETVLASDPCSRSYHDFNYRAEFLYAWSDISYLPMLHGGPFNTADTDTATVDYSVAELIAHPAGGGNYLFADGHVKYLQVSYANSHRDIFNVIKN